MLYLLDMDWWDRSCFGLQGWGNIRSSPCQLSYNMTLRKFTGWTTSTPRSWIWRTMCSLTWNSFGQVLIITAWQFIPVINCFHHTWGKSISQLSYAIVFKVKKTHMTIFHFQRIINCLLSSLLHPSVTISGIVWILYVPNILVYGIVRIYEILWTLHHF